MIEHRYADLDDIRMHYAIAGRGEPVLLLHGFPEYWGVWKPVMADLARDYQVVAPDLRGYNLTTRPAAVSDYRIENLVADVRGLIEHLGAGPVKLVAQDWGAFLGWSFLLRHPELVERYATIDITHPHLFNEALQSDPAQQKASEYMLFFRTPEAPDANFTANDFAEGKKAVFEAARARGAALSDADVEEWLAAWQKPGAMTAGLNWYRATEMGPPDGKGSPGGSKLLEGLDPSRYHVDMPVLVIWGEDDPYLLPSGLDRLHRYVRDLRIHKVAGVDHWVTLEKPDLVARLLREHFRS
jgi:pimeloyl-ACP methyl ester carboxylesterase